MNIYENKKKMVDEERGKEREFNAREGTFRGYLYASGVLGYERLALNENLIPTGEHILVYVGSPSQT